MNTMSLRRVMVGLVLVGVLAAFVQADKLDVQAKLSKEVNIQLKDVTIVEALEEIGKKAELEILLSDEALWKLPQGGATRLRVMLQGPLSESLTEMLNTFFMRYAVGQEQITIYPRPELEHILGRPTTRQLELLKDIYTKPVRAYWAGEPQRAINRALGREVIVLPIELHDELDEMLELLREKTKVTRHVEEVVDESGGRVVSKVEEGDDVRHHVEEVIDQGGGKVVTEKVEKTRYELSAPVTIAQLLSRRVWKWYLSGMDFPDQIPEIRVVGEEEFRRAKLGQIVDISMEDEAAVIIQRLADWSGIELVVIKNDPDWPGAFGLMGVEMQNIRLGQALRNVITMVDGTYEMQGNTILIAGPKHEAKRRIGTPAATPQRPKDSGKITRASGDYVGKISIPMDGGKYFIEFMLRESDLTEKLRKLRDEKMEQILGRPPRPRRRAAVSKPAAAAHAESRVTATRFSLKMLHTAVTEFKMDTGRLPTEEEGLMALIEQPSDVAGYSEGGYIKNKEMLKDAWGREFIYQLWYEDRPFVIFSYGADGKEGGQGEDADLWSTKATAAVREKRSEGAPE